MIIDIRKNEEGKSEAQFLIFIELMRKKKSNKQKNIISKNLCPLVQLRRLKSLFEIDDKDVRIKHL